MCCVACSDTSQASDTDSILIAHSITRESQLAVMPSEQFQVGVYRAIMGCSLWKWYTRDLQNGSFLLVIRDEE